MTKHKNNPSNSSSRCLHDKEKKNNNMFNISTLYRPSDRRRYKRSHRIAPSTYDTAEKLQHTQPTVGR